MTLKALLIAVAVILLAGCGSSGSGFFEPISVTIRVLAPSGKCWTFTIAELEEEHEGCGTKSFDDVASAGEWSAQKQTPGRWRLRLVLTSETGEIKDTASTRARHGRVTVAYPLCC